MEGRLYPDLDPFYRFSNVEYGAQIEECDPDYPSIDTIENKTPNPSKLLGDSDDTLQRRVPITPSAPPLTEGGTSLLESLYSYIMEELEPPPYSPNDPLSDGDAWTDDLQPDYDISGDDVIGLPEINDLSVGDNNIDNTNTTSQVENHRPHHGNSNNNNEQNPCQRIQQSTNANNEQSSRERNERSTKNNNGAKNDNNDINNMMIVTNRNLESGDTHHHHGGKHGKNGEYGAWVTWRKNVNRQLATVILLKRGGHVHLQKADLSRRPLSRTSMDYVIRNARNGINNSNNSSGDGRESAVGAKTSLNGTPYIMYGIPRVALSKKPPKRN